MAQLMEMVETRRKQAGLSYEDYARKMDLRTSALYKLVKQSTTESKSARDISVPNFQKMLYFYRQQRDSEMIKALIMYVTGLEGRELDQTLAMSFNGEASLS